MFKAVVVFKSFSDDAGSEHTENQQQQKGQPIRDMRYSSEGSWKRPTEVSYVKPRTFSLVTCECKGTTEACCLTDFHCFQSQGSCPRLESYRGNRKIGVPSVGLGVPQLWLMIESAVIRFVSPEVGAF